MTLQIHEHEAESDYAEIRRLKIVAYAERQNQRTDIEKENDFQDIYEFQNKWIEHKINEPSRSWERWDGTFEEWEPWNRFGETVNIWRRYKKK